MKTISERWDLFKVMVVPAEAGPTQISEMKMAFFAGAEEMKNILVVELPDAPNQKDAYKILNGLETEIRAFAESVGRKHHD